MTKEPHIITESTIKFNYTIFYIGLFILGFFIWTRFFRIHLPKSLDSFSMDPLLSLIAILSAFFFTLLAFYTVIKIIRKDNANKKLIENLYNIAIIKIFFEVYIKYIKEAPLHILEYSSKKIKFDRFLEKPTMYVLKKMAGKNKLYIIFFINIVPKILISATFLGDIFIFNELNYFYKSLYLLVLPLLMNAYIFITENIATRNFIFYISHLKEIPSNREGYLKFALADEIPNFEGALDIKNNKELFSWILGKYDIYCNIYNFIMKLKDAEQNTKLYVNLYVFGCYSIGWLYICSTLDYSLSLQFLHLLLENITEPFSDIKL